MSYRRQLSIMSETEESKKTHTFVVLSTIRPRSREGAEVLWVTGLG